MSCPPPDGRGNVDGIDAVAWTVHEIAPLVMAWQDCPDELAAEFDEWLLDPAELRPPAPGTMPHRGWITEHPVYAAMWSQPQKLLASDYEPTIARYVQGAYLVGAHLAMRLPGGLEARHSSLRRAGLSVRRFVGNRHTPRDLWSITYPDDVRSFIRELEGLSRRQLSRDEYSLLIALIGFLRSARQGLPARARRRVEVTGRIANQSWEPDSPVFPHVTIDQVLPQPGAYVKEGGAAVSESATTQMMIVAAEKGEDHLTAGQMYFRARYRALAIATAAQGVLYSPDRLQLVDLAGLDQFAEGVLDGRIKITSKIEGLAVAACFVSLLTGRTVEQLQSMVLLRSWRDLRNVDGAMGWDPSTGNLYVRVEPPRDAYKPPPQESKYYRETKTLLALQLPSLRYVQAASLILGEATHHNPFRFDGIAAEVDKLLRRVNTTFNARATPARVAQFLHSQAHLITGDWADADLLSGHRRYVDPRLYYYAPSTRYLAKIYNTIWRGVAKGLDVKLEHLPVPFWLQNDWCVGSAACPTDDAVSAMVHSQREFCRDVRQGAPGRKRVVPAHNALTIYTLLMIAWHTGVRAVDEMVDLTQYDPATGLLGVSDKDGDTYADARVVWLPPTAQQQVAVYWKCVATLPEHLREAGAYNGALFLLDDEGKTHSLSLRNIRLNLKEYPFRLNAQRHYLRTRLRELNVPAQAVDALLGHGMRGQEPYARHTAYSAQQMKREVAPAIQKLSRKMGWKVIPARS